ncbi:MAG: hypothetical protein Q9170_000492 [Blastenia crenularia]
MDRGPIVGSESDSGHDIPTRPSKRRKICSPGASPSSVDKTVEEADRKAYSTRRSLSADKENDDPEASKVKKPRYRIHIPHNPKMPEDTFLTQPPSRSPSPYRIDKFCWKKPKRPEAQVYPPVEDRAKSSIDKVLTQQGHNDVTRASIVADDSPDRLVIRPQLNHSVSSRAGKKVASNQVPKDCLQLQRQDCDQTSSAEISDGYDDVLADLPSDAFSSPEPQAKGLANAPIEISSQDLSTQGWPAYATQNQRLAAPLANLRQTTLFGDEAHNTDSQTQSVRKRNWPLANREEAPTHHQINREAMQTWVYPTNLGKIRSYQYSIVASGLYHNMLVALPTGLGKTFIAATIMLNWFRWTKDAQIVFVAPTKPLVSQQVKACFEIAGIPRSTTTMLTGVTPPGVRAEEWLNKRVFFMTPQTIVNDLKTGICDPKRLVLLVVDEAHRATGGYAYVEVVQFLRRFNSSFRVLALTATPGASIESVQEVIDGLGISRIEIRTEESLDIREYVYARKIETVLFESSDEMVMVMDLFAKALQPLVDKLCGMNAYWGKDPMTLTPYGCNQARTRWMSSDAGRKANFGTKSMVNTIFSLLASLAHGIELLKFHGIGPFYHKTLSFRNETRDKGDKSSKYRKQVDQSQPFETMMSRVRTWINNPDFVGHPKLEYLQRVVLNHFLDAGEGRGASGPSGTRIMVFAHYRDSAEEITRVLKRNEPMIRPRVFVGQATSNSSEGMGQKTQLDVIEKFKNGVYNTLVATSIGEEGLDIGEVDLIVCYDASASPIRMLQRMGRTGRKRAGNIVVTLMKGKEENNFIKAKDNYEKMQQAIASGARFAFHEEQSHRIVPREIQPVVDKKIVDIPVENTQAELPEPSKRMKVPKKPPKKFNMPDGVRKGFVKASRLEGDESDDSEISSEIQPQPRQESPERFPPLSEVLLSGYEQKELERCYLDVKGDFAEIVETPRVDTFPALQRNPRPTKHLSHGRMTKRTAKMLRAMHAFTVGTGKDFGTSLHADDRREGLLQFEKRASFFAKTTRPSRTALSFNAPTDPGFAMIRTRSSFRSSSPFSEKSQADSMNDTTHYVKDGIPHEIEPDLLEPSPSPACKLRAVSDQPASSSASEEDLPDFSALVERPSSGRSAPVATRTSGVASRPQSQPYRGRRVIVENDSDEE